MEIKNAIITDWKITNDYHSCLSMWVYLDYGGAGQGFGGYSLGNKQSEFVPNGGNYCAHFIAKVMECAGVECLSQPKGKTLRVQAEHNKVHAIGHIIENKWFNPSEDFSKKRGAQ